MATPTLLTARAETTWRTVWTGLLGVAATWATAMLLFPHARSWHYFRDAAGLLFSSTAVGGSRFGLYAVHPEFQFGPVSIVAARAFTRLPAPLDVWSVMVAGALAGVGILALLVDVVRRFEVDVDDTALRRVVVLVSIPFLVAWMRVAAYSAHLDDVLVLLSMAGALAAIARRRPGWATVLVAVAIAAKPWAVIFAPLCWRGTGRWRLLRPPAAIAAAVASWVPFVWHHPDTVTALRRFTIPVDVNSGLHVLGVIDQATPGWLRPAQLALGLVATGVVALRKDRWPTILAAGMATRLMIDPATHHYYTAGFVVGALLWELCAHPRSFPWRTVVAGAVLEITASTVTLGGSMAWVRFLMLAGVVVAAMAGGWGLPSVDHPEGNR